MKQLSGADTMFLQFERGNNHMHVASLAIYDPSTAPGGGVRFKDVLRFFASRLEQFPQFRRRLVTVPFALDRPYWVEDPCFDVEFHVRHIALPHPGDWRQLCIQVARLHSRPIDHSKPLWEAYVIEGLHDVPGAPAGSFAVYCKMHHAIIDGESGTELLKALHSISPEPLDLGAEEPGTTYGAPHEPRLPELYSLALLHNVERLPSLARLTLGTARRLAGLGAGVLGRLAARGPDLLPRLRSLASGDLSPLVDRLPPQTRFSGKVSAHRVFEAVGLPLAEFKPIRAQAEGATLNDLFLAIVGGALNRYLGAKGELPDSSMVAMVPMTLRGSEKGGDRGNQVGFTLMPVYSEIADPLERLGAIRDSARTSKRVSDAVGKELARDLLEYLPAPVSDVLLRNVRLPGIGLIVSNVRGPDVPLYMAGARLVNYSPISIAIDGLGLNVTGFSYAGTMWICAVSCREMLPDPAFFAECLRESFAELRDAAGRAAAREAAGTDSAADAEHATTPSRATPRRRRKVVAALPAPAAKTVRRTKARDVADIVAAAPERPARTRKPRKPRSGRRAPAGAVRD
jgi:WS/DGAT/MGAT family acyltransferase